MPESISSSTTNLTLAEVIHRLSHRREVDGLLLIGSAASGTLSPASDYDLVIVLAEMPTPLHVGVTNIDGRFADLVFCTTDQVVEILTAELPFLETTWVGRLVAWLEQGEIVFDRSARLSAAQAKVRTGSWRQAPSAAARTGVWSRVNYNLQVVRRYLASDDPRYLAAADLRMLLYGPADLFFGYFTVRQLPWAGEKEAITYLEEHDSGYLADFRRFLAMTDRTKKAHLYMELAAATIEPVGPLWTEESTVMLLDGNEVTSEMEEEALAFWALLVG